MDPLDQFRQNWQQAATPAATAPLDATKLHELVAKAPVGVVAKMRRNVWRELILIAVLSLVILVSTFFIPKGAAFMAKVPVDKFLLFIRLGTLILAAVMVTIYYNKLRVLRQLDEAVGNALQPALRQGLASFRALLRMYFIASLASMPIYMIIGVYGGYLADEVLGKHTKHPEHDFVADYWLAVIPLGILVSLLLQRMTKKSTLNHFYRLYGQHIDRLEGYLRELEER